jgi:PKD repeat protein
MRNGILTGLLAIGLLTGNLALVAGSASASSTDEAVELGMGPGSLEPQQNHGVAPDYQTIWIGPWTLESGWAGVNDQLEYMQSQGVTPVIQFYYWGDDISPSCFENGCWSDLHDTHKYKEEWQQLARELVDNLHKTMDGDRVVILLETEFNKNGMEDYEPFDEALESKAHYFHDEYPASEVVLSFGNWKSWAWDTYDRSAAASDYIGIQGLRGSTQDSWDSYHSLYEDTLHGVEKMQDIFGQPIFITDIGLSSYPEPDYLDPQANELQDFFDGMSELKAAGVEAMVYRGWHDNPDMDTNNYYGEAERHWGMAHSDGWEKPAADVWINGVQAERDGSPVGSFDASAEGRTVTFDASASSDPDGDDLTYTWDFGDGNRGDGEVVEHTFDEAGTYDVHMSVSDGDTKDTVYKSLSVENAAPSATFEATSNGTEAYFDADESTDPDDSNLTYTWDFGDGTRATGMHAEHVFPEDGTYDVHMSVSDGKTKDVTHQRVSVENGAPPAKHEHSPAGRAHTAAASGSPDPEGEDLEYRWDLGDGTRATGAQVDHTYEREGTYTLYMSAYDDDDRDTVKRVVEIDDPNNTAPEATYDVTKDGLDVSLDASASSDPDGDDLTYTWDFGDGARATGQTVDHTYAEPGTYKVHMSVDDGLTKTTTKQTITVGEANDAPDAAYNVNKNGLKVYVTGWPSEDPDGDGLNHVWDFGDGNRASGQSLVHYFDEPGTYKVHMSATDGEYKDTTKQTITVGDANEAPTASYEYNKDALDVSFDATASEDPNGDGLTYVWDFGDGTRARGETPDHTFDEPGTYKVHMSVSDGEYKHTTMHEITVGEPYSAEFDPKSQDNEWWVEVGVNADPNPAKVEFRADGGDWVKLDKTDWGTWAKSVHVEPGSEVEFRATSTAGETDTSRSYTWG